MNPIDINNIHRNLSSSESFFANLCERGTNTIGVVWAVSGPVTPELLCSALDHLGTVHPYLRSEIVKGNNKEDKFERKWKPIEGRKWYSFEKVSAINAKEEDNDSISRQSLDILEKTFLEPFVAGDDTKSGSPLSRFWLVQYEDKTEEEIKKKKCEIVLAVSHGLMDGRSTTLLIDHLLLTMSELYNGKQPSLTVQDETKLLEEESLAGIDDEKRNDSFASLPISKIVSAKERSWAVTSYTTKKSSSFFDSLKLSCKAHQVSVNAAILASFVLAADTTIVSAVDVGGALSGRQLSSSHVFAVMSEIEKTADLSFWDIAKIYQQKLVKSVEGKKWLPTNPSYSDFFEADFIDQHKHDVQGRRDMGDLNRLFESSDIWSHSPFHVTDMCLSPNQQILGSCFIVGAAFFNGNLNLTVGFPCPTYERSFMEELVGLAITLLRQNSVQ